MRRGCQRGGGGGGGGVGRLDEGDERREREVDTGSSAM